MKQTYVKLQKRIHAIVKEIESCFSRGALGGFDGVSPFLGGAKDVIAKLFVQVFASESRKIVLQWNMLTFIEAEQASRTRTREKKHHKKPHLILPQDVLEKKYEFFYM